MEQQATEVKTSTRVEVICEYYGGQGTVAKHLQFPRSSINDWKNDKNPRPKSLAKINRAYETIVPVYK